MKITVDEVLQEGNWQAGPWSPRLPDEAAFRAFVQGIVERAATQVQWRVGDAHYDSASEPQASVLKEAELHLAQEAMLLAAADLADSAGDLAAPPFQGGGDDLRAAAAARRARAEALVAPYEQATGQPGWRQPATRAGAPEPAVRPRFNAE
ncbi:MAG: hypothetical protein HY320_08940 [Armatimonadetes bacterium]|nr:hypothetical protein [Armatimonadota bacterium]